MSKTGGYSNPVLNHVCDCTAAAVCASSHMRALSVFVSLLFTNSVGPFKPFKGVAEGFNIVCWHPYEVNHV